MARLAFIPGGVLILALLFAGAARAETHRLAVVVGSNAGSAERPALRYAETDAGKVARVLVELGGVAPGDMLLLQGRSLDELERAFLLAAERTRQWHVQPDTRIIFFFYFSGHSDGTALELGADRLDFRALKTSVAKLGADVRLVIVDSCRSGSLLESKGGTRAEPFEIHLTDDLTNSGEALITSSAANEIALESGEIRGSFFTHHLISGLRGAADLSGDGQITLAEAYEYAFSHTTSATANTLTGIQHPSYDYRLSGQGELVVTEFVARSARLVLPAGYRRMLVTQVIRDQVIVELTTGTGARVALPPGTYGVRAWRNDKVFVARVELQEHGERALQAGELVEQPATEGVGKGSEGADATGTEHRANGFAIGAAFGQTAGIGHGLGTMNVVRLGALFSQEGGFAVNLDGAWGSSETFSEVRGMASFGYRLARTWGRFSAFAGPDVEAGFVAQRRTTGDRAASPVAGPSVSLGAAWWIDRRIAIDLEAKVLGGIYQRDSAPAFSFWPSAYIGLLAIP